MCIFAPDRIAACRIGLFWFIAKDRNLARFAEVSRPWSSVPTVAGKKALDQEHADVWSIVQKLDHKLQRYPGDYFPRGRLIWLEDRDRWELMVDQKLNRGAFVAHIAIAWKTPLRRLVVNVDSEYRSLACVGVPKQIEGSL
jgi:hypothetical protein